MCATRSGPDLCFLCDQNLGRLTRWLRILGFDAEYMHGYDQGRIDRAIADGRIVLTRKSSLAGLKSLAPCGHAGSNPAPGTIKSISYETKVRPFQFFSG